MSTSEQDQQDQQDQQNQQDQRIVRLSRDENGIEVWLDLQTGQQLSGAVDRDPPPALHPLIAVAAAALAEREWNYEVRNARHLCCHLVGAEARFLLCFTAYEDRPVLMCTGEIPVRVPEGARGRAVEYVNRVNHLLRCGNFELDYSDGEVRFRTSVDVSGGALLPEMVASLIGPTTAACERYFRGLMDVVFAAKAPGDAAEEAAA